MQAKTSASKVGDSHKLSETDLQLLALALELKTEGVAPQIVTDDYSIQNVATQMGIGFLALATFGIKRLWNGLGIVLLATENTPATVKLRNAKFAEPNLRGNRDGDNLRRAVATVE